MGLVSRLLGIDELARSYEKRFDEKHSRLMSEKNILESEIGALKSALENKKNEIKVLHEKIRDQTEADLFLECEKVKIKILAGHKKKEIDLSIYQSLTNQAAAQQRMMMNQGMSGGIGLLGGVANMSGRTF